MVEVHGRAPLELEQERAKALVEAQRGQQEERGALAQSPAGPGELEGELSATSGLR
jgi:hypothetical protein